MGFAVLGYGFALWDLLADQLGVPREQVVSWTPYPGGAGLNVACHLGRLGVPTALVSAVGQDPWGTQVLQVLQSYNVCTDYLQRLPYPTRLVEVLRRQDGEREFAGFRPADCPAFADAFIAFQPPPWRPACLYIEGVVLAFPQSRATAFALVDWASQQEVMTLVDVNWRPTLWTDEALARSVTQALVQRVQGVKLTADEAQWLFGTDDPDVLHRQCPNLAVVLVTQGAQGCAYRVGSHSGHSPAFPVTAVDTTGAGDAFVAGWLHQWVTQGPALTQDRERLQAALRWANAVAAISTTAPGAITRAPTSLEVAQFLAAHRPEPTSA
ncbi:MAG: carbohydrate kinase [Gloeomargarita sp. SKYBB_i_bin120]|nr:carbohydrate kinase [Gloeomargarita sp. SKYG98]MCS7292001.1 carbohydrate kinase [Gloeomargarita sp. SKYB120]MDW8177561.1 carbohydrate kinase [Gloeomargarita sp. SKYBB_i_bin120]